MAKYRVEIKKSAVKEIKNLPQKVLKKILAIIKSLHDDPRPHGSKKLSSSEKYRIRYGQYRILYAIEEAILTIYIVKVGHRKDVYR
jgi:mRNA interferase RelE/StbE